MRRHLVMAITLATALVLALSAEAEPLPSWI